MSGVMDTWVDSMLNSRKPRLSIESTQVSITPDMQDIYRDVNILHVGGNGYLGGLYAQSRLSRIQHRVHPSIHYPRHAGYLHHGKYHGGSQVYGFRSQARRGNAGAGS